MSRTGARVVVEKERLHISPSGQLRGPLLFEFGSQYFPAPNWQDAVVVLLEWWLRALLPLQRAHAQKAELLFMEGPYQVDVRAISAGLVALRRVDRGRKSSVDGEEVEVPLAELIVNICDASEIVIERSVELDFHSRDLDRLVKVLTDARKSVPHREPE